MLAYSQSSVNFSLTVGKGQHFYHLIFLRFLSAAFRETLIFKDVSWDSIIFIPKKEEGNPGETRGSEFQEGKNDPEQPSAVRS